MFSTINPATGQLIAQFDLHTPAQVEAKLVAVHQAQRQWAQVSTLERAKALRFIAQELRSQSKELAALITLEMGKPIVEAEAEIEKCAWTCDYYAEFAPVHLADETIASSASLSQVVFNPLGVVLAVMPWNYPFWQVLRFAAPAIAAGNGAVLKHANNVPQCAMAIERVIHQALEKAGAPKDIFVSLLVASSSVKALIEDPRICAVTLTGSTPVGKLVASQAGAVLKKQVLELGGSDPFIVLADADIAAAAKAAVKARFSNTGQSCISSKRFLVIDSVAEQFVEAFAAGARALKMAEPTLRDTQIGPMARGNLRDELHSQVERSLAAGARLVCGGNAIAGPGYYYEATVLDHVQPHMAAAAEETFGPVAAVLRVKSAEEAIAIANDTEFGLAAAIWTGDAAGGAAYARQLEAGAVFVNGMVASDPRLPFGGIKQSGYGRELGSYGIREFTNIKTVWVGPAR
ncbi:MAG: NAD-dependent succinate-semialdehyde dehydrogenase [Burkholderiales bacterium]|nr:MAG: NAD-dependent succinate-semialdehyde dehydrogenase [Burkholderiales bacterium]